MGKTMQNFTEQTHTLGLYDPQFEHDACGIGAVVDIKGRKSHQTVDDALRIVERLEHRAGKDAEGKTGDGVGILLQISHKFFSKVADELNIRLGNEREYGVGMFFFPQNEHMRAQAMKLFEVVTRKEGLEFLAWRKVPVDPDAVGQKARDCMPSIWQCFIKKPAKVSKGIDFDRKLYVVRRVFEQASNGTYVPSLSSRTIVYKGMFLVHDLRLFYADLQDPDYESAIGMVHSRFSTNTNPSCLKRREEKPDYTGQEEFNFFLAVAFPDSELEILPYNRVVRYLNGLSPDALISQIEQRFIVKPVSYTHLVDTLRTAMEIMEAESRGAKAAKTE